MVPEGQSCDLVVYKYGSIFQYGIWSKNDLVKVGIVKEGDNALELGTISINKVIYLNHDNPFVHVDYNEFEPHQFNSYFNEVLNLDFIDGREPQYEKLKSRKVYTLHYNHSAEVFTNLGAGLSHYHVSTGMANLCKNERNTLLAYISADKSLHLSLILNNEFHFYNQYYCETSQDYLYYFMLVFESFELDKDTFDVKFGGAINEKSTLYQFLTSYLPTLQLFTSSSHNISDSTKGLHEFLPFLMAKECA